MKNKVFRMNFIVDDAEIKNLEDELAEGNGWNFEIAQPVAEAFMNDFKRQQRNHLVGKITLGVVGVVVTGAFGYFKWKRRKKKLNEKEGE